MKHGNSKFLLFLIYVFTNLKIEIPTFILDIDNKDLTAQISKE